MLRVKRFANFVMVDALAYQTKRMRVWATVALFSPQDVLVLPDGSRCLVSQATDDAIIHFVAGNSN